MFSDSLECHHFGVRFCSSDQFFWNLNSLSSLEEIFIVSFFLLADWLKVQDSKKTLSKTRKRASDQTSVLFAKNRFCMRGSTGEEKKFFIFFLLWFFFEKHSLFFQKKFSTQVFNLSWRVLSFPIFSRIFLWIIFWVTIGDLSD